MGGNLDAQKGKFENPSGKDPALDADGLQVGGSVLLDGSSTKGGMSLRDARVEGNFEVKGGQFEGKNLQDPPNAQDALNADGIKVDGSILIGQSSIEQGYARFADARVNGRFEVAGSWRPSGGLILKRTRRCLRLVWRQTSRLARSWATSYRWLYL